MYIVCGGFLENSAHTNFFCVWRTPTKVWSNLKKLIEDPGLSSLLKDLKGLMNRKFWIKASVVWFTAVHYISSSKLHTDISLWSQHCSNIQYHPCYYVTRCTIVHCNMNIVSVLSFSLVYYYTL